MRTQGRVGWVVVAAAGWAIGCGANEVVRPADAASAGGPGSAGDLAATTTTSSAGPGAGGRTSNVSVSDALAKACGIRFGDAPGAPKFDFDRAELRPDDSAVLDQVARCLTTGTLKGRRLRLVGRADPRGEVEYNFALGEHRAGSVVRYLRGLGVDASQLTETSRGKLDAKGTDEPGWQLDRRVDLDLE